MASPWGPSQGQVGAAVQPVGYMGNAPFAAPAAAPAPAPVSAPWAAPLLGDLSGDGVVTADEARAQEVFQSLDKNHDGVVNASELAVEVVAFEFKVSNVDYEELSADKTLLENFIDGIKGGIVESTGNLITMQDVAVELSPGSVVVDASITPPANMTAYSLQNAVDTQALGGFVTAAISAIPGIGAVLTGTPGVEILKMPETETRMEISQEELDAADANHDGVLSVEELSHVPGVLGDARADEGVSLTLLPAHLAENAFCGPHGRCLGELLVAADVRNRPGLAAEEMELQCALEKFRGASKEEHEAWLHCSGRVVQSKAFCRLPMVQHLNVGDHLQGRCFLSDPVGANLTKDEWFMVENDHKGVGADLIPVFGLAARRGGGGPGLGACLAGAAALLVAALLAE